MGCRFVAMKGKEERETIVQHTVYLPVALYNRLVIRAERERRSINKQIISELERSTDE